MSLIVKKFGGTSVANKERIFNVARRCIEDYKKGNDVVVVLSAMGKYTDELITMAKDINDKPPKREMDMLFTIGEQMSVALMSMAMDSLGVPAVSLNAFQVAMHTTSAHGSARLKKIDAARIRRELDNRRIVVVTGFQGIDKYNDYTTLGRGGSDTTAVALAAALHADACEIYTDVDGVYTADPRIVPDAQKMEEITYDEMLEMASLGAKVLHSRCVEIAKKYGVELLVCSSLNRNSGTIVRENTKMEKMVQEGTAILPTDEEERAMYWFVKDYLEKHKYKHYEISNFAKPGFESKHNTDCWKQKEYIGIGAAACSFMDNKRYSNIESLEQYIENIENGNPNRNLVLNETLNEEDKMNEFMMLGLRKIDGVNIGDFKKIFGVNPIMKYCKTLDKLTHEDLIQVDENSIKLSKKGIDLANLVWEEFV